MTHAAVAKGRPWSGRYPPLIAVVVALALAVFALPSALNLPQANPGQTLEYAPVPGNNGQAPPGGNLAGLGLGQSGTVGSGGEGTTSVTPSALSLLGNPPTSPKQCVGNPPRQTEDPLSPPCVAFFNGDNGGATYTGVSRGELRIVMYFTTSQYGVQYCGVSDGCESSPTPGTVYDLWQAPQSSEGVDTRSARVWQTYFNSRYQTYNRRAHFFVKFSSCGSGASGNCTQTVDSARADAADVDASIHPFAIIAPGDFGDAFTDYMAQHGVMDFGGGTLHRASYFQRYPKLFWDYYPSAEELAQIYSSWVCTKVQPYTVSSSGNGDTGSPRKYGFIMYDGAAKPDLTYLDQLIIQEIGRCGVTITDQMDYSYLSSGPDPSDPSHGTSEMARFKTKGITTILWPYVANDQAENAAAAASYYPEWLTLATGESVGAADSQENASIRNQREYAHAWVVTPRVRADPHGFAAECEEAYHSVDPGVSPLDLVEACIYYEVWRQLFTGVQVSGPHLTPANIDQGFRAIPPKSSTNPDVPSCFYVPGDNTCVKDGMWEYWDPNGKGSGQLQTQGCWRMILDAQRFLPNQWPSGDFTAQQHIGADQCNAQT